MAQQQGVGAGGTGGSAEPRVAAMWPVDRVERARLWGAAMARGVAAFWSRHAAEQARAGGAR